MLNRPLTRARDFFALSVVFECMRIPYWKRDFLFGSECLQLFCKQPCRQETTAFKEHSVRYDREGACAKELVSSVDLVKHPVGHLILAFLPFARFLRQATFFFLILPRSPSPIRIPGIPRLTNLETEPHCLAAIFGIGRFEPS